MAAGLEFFDAALLAGLAVHEITRADIQAILSRLDDMPDRFDCVIGALDDAQAGGGLVLLRVV